jgi:hypothetical protein
MARRQWIEPPRFRPFAQVKLIGGEYMYVVTVCPGAIPKSGELQYLNEEVRTLALPAYYDIGPLIETTHDADDPPTADVEGRYQEGKARTLQDDLPSIAGARRVGVQRNHPGGRK